MKIFYVNDEKPCIISNDAPYNKIINLLFYDTTFFYNPLSIRKIFNDKFDIYIKDDKICFNVDNKIFYDFCDYNHLDYKCWEYDNILDNISKLTECFFDNDLLDKKSTFYLNEINDNNGQFLVKTDFEYYFTDTESAYDRNKILFFTIYNDYFTINVNFMCYKMPSHKVTQKESDLFESIRRSKRSFETIMTKSNADQIIFTNQVKLNINKCKDFIKSYGYNNPMIPIMYKTLNELYSFI